MESVDLKPSMKSESFKLKPENLNNINWEFI